MATSILLHGTKENSNRVERIAVSLASSAVFKYSKKVIILPMSPKYDCGKVLMGSRLKENTILGRGISFDDNGVDALLRRMEQGTLREESFSDCCLSAVKTANGFDIASPSKRKDFSEYAIKNERFIKAFIEQAMKIYDLVIVVADGADSDLVRKLEMFVETEAVVIKQGNKAEAEARKDALYIINDYDGASLFTYKKMKQIYGITEDTKLYPIPYNIRFKDFCRTDNAIEFLTANIQPDQTDENYVFSAVLKRFASAVLKLEEPVIKERRFTSLSIERRKNIRGNI